MTELETSLNAHYLTQHENLDQEATPAFST